MSTMDEALRAFLVESAEGLANMCKNRVRLKPCS